MEKEIEEYLTGRASLLNSQLRGAINQVARTENLQLIELTFLDIWKTGYEFGMEIKRDKDALDKFKQSLKEDEDDQ